jgi:hypothetical protein
MDEFGTGGRGAPCQIAFLQKHDFEAAASRVGGDSCPVDASTDDSQIEDVSPHASVFP